MPVVTPERRALADRIRGLRGEGLTQIAVARRLGISRSYVSDLERDPDGLLAAARKDSYREPCPECGTLMDGSNGRKGPSLCATCMHAKQAAAKVWTREAVIAAIQGWALKHGRPPTSTEWINGSEDHPARSSVYRSSKSTRTAPFATWNEAIIAAGFTPYKVMTTWQRWTPELVAEELLANAEDGHAPGSRMGEAAQSRLYRAAVTHWGSWAAAIKAAGLLPPVRQFTSGQGNRQRQLRGVLAAGPMRQMHIAREMGISEQWVSSVLCVEVRAGRVRRVSRGVYELVSS